LPENGGETREKNRRTREVRGEREKKTGGRGSKASIEAVKHQ